MMEQSYTEGSNTSLQAEERATGSIGVRMYLQYLAAWSPLFLVPAATFGFAAGERVLSVRGAVQRLRVMARSSGFGVMLGLKVGFRGWALVWVRG